MMTRFLAASSLAALGWLTAIAFGLPPFDQHGLYDATTFALVGAIAGAGLGNWIDRI